MTNVAGQDRDDDKSLKCPKCTAAMEKVTFHEIVVDRCTACKGIWFDALEQEHLAAIPGSETIDTGASPTQRSSEHKKLICPVCHTPMIDMVDHRHPHLWYESCTVCYGVFFDAGEFRDYREHSVMETIGSWFRGKGR